MSGAIARNVVQSFAKAQADRPDLQMLSPREHSVLDEARPHAPDGWL